MFTILDKMILHCLHTYVKTDVDERLEGSSL